MTVDHRKKLELLIEARALLEDAARQVREATGRIKEAALGLDLATNVAGAQDAARRIDAIAARVGIVVERIPS